MAQYVYLYLYDTRGILETSLYNFHCVESVQIRSFSCSVFSRIRTEYREIIALRNQSECWKTRTRKNSVFGHISHGV